MIKLPRIKFVKSGLNAKYGNKYRKVFRIFFHTAEIPTEPYGACFFHQGYNVDVDLIIGTKGRVYLGEVKAPMIIVTRQDNFFKTLKSFLHELGHYVIWVFTYWNKRNRIYDYITEIYEELFQAKTPLDDLIE